MVYGSLAYFDPPNLKIKRPLNLEYYGGSLELEEETLLNFENMNYETKQIIVPKGVETTTIPKPKTTTVPEGKKAPYFIFKECKALIPPPTENNWTVSFRVTSENSAVNILYYEIAVDGILARSDTVELYVPNYESTEVTFIQKFIPGIKTANSINVTAEVYTVDGIKITRGCKTLISKDTTNTTTTTINSAPYWNPDPLTVTRVQSTTADVIWGQANDDKEVTKFRIYLNGTRWIEFDNNNSNRKTITSLSPDTCYTVTVRAGDADGNWSDESRSRRFCTLSSSASAESTTTVPPTSTTTTTTTTVPPTSTTTTTTTVPPTSTTTTYFNYSSTNFYNNYYFNYSSTNFYNNYYSLSKQITGNYRFGLRLEPFS